MKLSIIIICWNDLKVIVDCLRSIILYPQSFDYEVIVSDNGSTDGSVNVIRGEFPQVRIVENGANLGFARGNNAGIAAATGEYILILNPDTIIHDGAIESLIRFAEMHNEAGAFGCKVLNSDGSFQNPARPLPTVRSSLIAALYLSFLGRFAEVIKGNVYVGWDGNSEREVGFQSGCCILFRGNMLRDLNGFDPRFFYHFEEADLCKRVWDSGFCILYTPSAVITHLGGQSVGRFPIRFALETCRSRYRYFYKHFGAKGTCRIRFVWLLHVGARYIGYSLAGVFKMDESLKNRLAMYRVVWSWNWKLDAVQFAKTGVEPNLGYEPLAPAPVSSANE